MYFSYLKVKISPPKAKTVLKGGLQLGLVGGFIIFLKPIQKKYGE